jgi:hypothetical protein
VGLIKFERMQTKPIAMSTSEPLSPKADKIRHATGRSGAARRANDGKLPLFVAENARQSRRIYCADGNNRIMMTFAVRTTILAVRSRGVCFDVRLQSAPCCIAPR